LPRILPEKETRSALASLWKYNFTPDVGPYRKAYPPGRWYAMPGEGGLLMCSFPRTDWDYDKAKGKGPDWAAGYFNECMNGFEYQAAGHMIWEGLVQEGLAVTRMLHDRYHASRRNPFNEVECGDHYARSMASYGVYLAACGYRYDGPTGTLAFDPRLSPEDFRAAFTTAQGWGSFSQKRQGDKQSLALNLRWGTLYLRSFACGIADNAKISQVKGRIKSGFTDQSMEFTLKPSFKINGKEVAMTFEKEIILQAGQTLEIEIQ
jgi:non-lysosomal glucosylceramidase